MYADADDTKGSKKQSAATDDPTCKSKHRMHIITLAG